MTIEDLRNPEKKSGFDKVSYDPNGSKIRCPMAASI
jgi:hypothetical protein